jgi:hypothetical protein
MSRAIASTQVWIRQGDPVSTALVLDDVNHAAGT